MSLKSDERLRTPAATIWSTRNRSALAQLAIYTQIAMMPITTERDPAVPKA